MANLSVKASSISDPEILLDRIQYRNERLKTKIGPILANAPGHEFARLILITGHNNSDMNRLREILKGRGDGTLE